MIMLDFDALAGDVGTGADVIEPRKIFTTLVRAPRFKFLSDNQGEVLDKWFEKRPRRDNTIKMNTGSGKMLVGLLVLQSSLNERVGPAVYITPDNYLARQVLDEARDLGIEATDDVKNAAFLAGRAILVVNVHKLINGKSVFGVGAQGVRIPVGSVVIDDAHACLESVADQFGIRVGAEHPVFEALLRLFEDDLKAQSEVGLVEIKGEDPHALMPVPFWAWKDKREQVLEVLHAHRASKELEFAWPLLKEVIPYCQCVFGGRGLEIAPHCLPIDELPSFARAKRRVYMTATLADDGVLITQLQADPDAVADPIKPKGAGEIGDRMIIAPQEVNENITDAEVKELATQIARTRNVVVIVPSAARAAFWQDVAAQVLNKDSIAAGVARLKTPGQHVGLTVLINRYDGVDLPEDACRLLVIDGLPEVHGLIERVEMSLLEDTESQLLRQIQRVEQGMGRGVRSGEDRCAVLLLGAKLTQRINMPEAQAMFTPATLAQMELGREITRQVKGKPVGDLLPILELCMSRDTRWWQAGRARLAKAPEGKQSHIDPSVVGLRDAFDLARSRQHNKAVEKVQEAVNGTDERLTKGYLKQQLAEYTHDIDPARAQEILLSAVADNRRVLKPLVGITYRKLSPPAASQAAASLAFMTRRFVDGNSLVLFINALLSDLSWSKDRTDQFEAAMRDVGLLLGFGSQRPEKDYRDGGPDNLWAVGGLEFLVIECKSGVDLDGRPISKDHCNQLLGAMSWFMRSYDDKCRATPVIVHPVARFQREASPSADMRVIDEACLAKLKNALKSLGTAVAAAGPGVNEAFLATQLAHFQLTGTRFVTAFTTGFTVEV